MTKKNLIIGVIVLIIFITGVVLWSQKNSKQDTKKEVKQEVTKETQEQKQTQKQENTQEQNNQNQVNNELTLEEIDTSNWKTYRNEELGFEFKYPNEWKYEFKQNNYGDTLIIRPISCSDTYGYYEDDCDDLVIILITDYSNDKLKTISGWSWATSERGGQVDKYTDNVMQVKLNIDDNFKAHLTNEFGKIHHRYFFEHDGLKYLFTVRYFDQKHNPKIEKTILETFHFIKK